MQESLSWVLIETVYNGGAQSDRHSQGEWARIISPFVQVKSNISLTTTVSRPVLALATVHLVYTISIGSVHLSGHIGHRFNMFKIYPTDSLA